MVKFIFTEFKIYVCEVKKYKQNKDNYMNYFMKNEKQIQLKYKKKIYIY